MINKRTINILILLSVLFLSLIVYLTYFQIVTSEKLSDNPYNMRQQIYEDDIERGDILDRDGVVLATNENNQRIYPFANMYAHVIGYDSPVYGKSMLEAKYNRQLTGQSGISQAFSMPGDKLGYDLMLTIDHDLQRLASEQLGNKNGAVIAMNPRNGEILAMVSKPNFDPNPDILASNWTNLTDSESFPFLPRATSGLYAPGSTFKIITGVTAIEYGLSDTIFDDRGTIRIGSKDFANYQNKSYGEIDMFRGFEVSSNVVYCSLGAQLGSAALKTSAERFGFNKIFDFDVQMSKSIFPDNQNDDELAAALAIGQGKILATPLQMAMVTAAIANDGEMMKPMLIKSVRNKNGISLMNTRPQKLYNCVSYDVAYQIQQAMVNTVKNGTGTGVAINGITVGAKTGTAENERTSRQNNKEHTWFTAFAPAEDPQIVVTIMMEYSGGTGAGNCAPIAREIIRKHLQ